MPARTNAGTLRRVHALLFATTSGAGHFLPLVPFAHACERAGHEVLVAGPPRAAPQAQRADLRFRGIDAPSQEDVARFRAGQRDLSPTQAMARALPELFVRLYGAAALPGMLDAIEHWRPDVVVRETAEFSAMIAAERLNVPHAQISVGLASQIPDQMLPLAAPRLDELRTAAGLVADSMVCPRDELVLTLVPASLDDPATPRSELVRRFRHPTDRAREAALDSRRRDADEPLVYVSFGTEVPSPARTYFPDLYRDVLAALAGLPIRILMTVGDERDPRELEPLPPSARVERWIPRAAAVHAATAMVGHGGSGSTLSALAAGVLMAVVPLFADQPRNARRVAELGAGIALDAGPAAVEPAIGGSRAPERPALPRAGTRGRRRDRNPAAGRRRGRGALGAGRAPARSAEQMSGFATIVSCR